jgi:hypothetical protein
METLLAEAAAQGLGDSFFVHYAPNHGRDEHGQEVIWLSQGEESGTTDFQFMLRGASRRRASWHCSIAITPSVPGSILWARISVCGSPRMITRR